MDAVSITLIRHLALSDILFIVVQVCYVNRNYYYIIYIIISACNVITYYFIVHIYGASSEDLIAVIQSHFINQYLYR